MLYTLKFDNQNEPSTVSASVESRQKLKCSIIILGRETLILLGPAMSTIDGAARLLVEDGAGDDPDDARLVGDALRLLVREER